VIEKTMVTYFESEAKRFVHTVLRFAGARGSPVRYDHLAPPVARRFGGIKLKGIPASASIVRTSNECACTGNSKYIPREITTQRPGCLTISKTTPQNSTDEGREDHYKCRYTLFHSVQGAKSMTGRIFCDLESVCAV